MRERKREVRENRGKRERDKRKWGRERERVVQEKIREGRVRKNERERERERDSFRESNVKICGVEKKSKVKLIPLLIKQNVNKRVNIVDNPHLKKSYKFWFITCSSLLMSYR